MTAPKGNGSAGRAAPGDDITRLHETGVLIIGGGAAAASAAVAAGETGARTTLILKKQLGRSGSTNFPGVGSAWQAADGCSGTDDSPAIHYADIMDAALGMADARMARILAEVSPERLQDLVSWGFQLIPDRDGKRQHYSGYSCFATQPRAHGMIPTKSGGHTGNMILTLAERLLRANVEVHGNTTVVDLLVDNGECVGAVAFSNEGELVIYRAAAVILATGGAAQMFPLSNTPGDVTGDGYAMAFRAGAELVNMEFMQYMLRTVHGRPPTVGGPFWTLNPVFRTPDGVEFLAGNLPAGLTAEEVYEERTIHYPFSSRDSSKWLDAAIQREVREGRCTPRGGVLVDFSNVDLSTVKPARPQHHPPADRMKMGDRVIEVAHSAHAINGGIRVDENGASTLPGPFAAGETIAGPHGADRLGGGMLAACAVFGTRAGAAAADRANADGIGDFTERSMDPVIKRLGNFGGDGRTNWHLVRKRLKTSAGRALVAVRNGDLMSDLLDEVQTLRIETLPAAPAGDWDGLIRILETDNLLLTAEIMTRAALMRTESRGSHFREDFPEPDDENWNKNIFWRKSQGNEGANVEPEHIFRRCRQDPDSKTQVVDVAD